MDSKQPCYSCPRPVFCRRCNACKETATDPPTSHQHWGISLAQMSRQACSNGCEAAAHGNGRACSPSHYADSTSLSSRTHLRCILVRSVHQALESDHLRDLRLRHVDPCLCLRYCLRRLMSLLPAASIRLYQDADNTANLQAGERAVHTQQRNTCNKSNPEISCEQPKSW